VPAAVTVLMGHKRELRPSGEGRIKRTASCTWDTESVSSDLCLVYYCCKALCRGAEAKTAVFWGALHVGCLSEGNFFIKKSCGFQHGTSRVSQRVACTVTQVSQWLGYMKKLSYWQPRKQSSIFSNLCGQTQGFQPKTHPAFTRA